MPVARSEYILLKGIITMKKFLCLVLAALMAVACLASCSKTGNDTPNGSDAVKGNPPTLKYLYNTSSGHKAIAE